MRLVDSPADRLKEVTIGLTGDKTLPNVLLGILAGAVIQLLAPAPSLWHVGAAAAAWWASVTLYAIVDELVARWEEERNRLLDPLEDGRPRGIE